MVVLLKNVIFFLPEEHIFAVLCYAVTKYFILTLQVSINTSWMISRGDDFNSTSVSNFLTSQFLIKRLSFNNQDYCERNIILPSIVKLGKIFLKKDTVQLLRARSLLHSACFETVSLNQHYFLRKFWMTELIFLIQLAIHPSSSFCFQKNLLLGSSSENPEISM